MKLKKLHLCSISFCFHTAHEKVNLDHKHAPSPGIVSVLLLFVQNFFLFHSLGGFYMFGI